MCGRFTSRKPDKIKIDGINSDDLKTAKPRYNIAPSQDVLSVISTGDEKHAVHLYWGLTPSWSKTPMNIINARAETLAEKPSFRDAFKRRRCLIIADGFYEWKKEERRKQPFYFQLADEECFAFAGIWETWKEDQIPINSCAIITTEPNDLLSPVHNRMPVILHPTDFETWLSAEARPDDLNDLLRPFPTEYMKGYAVSLDVNSPSVDDPHLTQEV